MDIAKLLRLADFLEFKVPEKQFNMHVWGWTTEIDKKQYLPDVNVCRTSACAGGWATICFKDPDFYLDATMFDGACQCKLIYMGYDGLKALSMFFDIDQYLSDYLFWAASYEDFKLPGPAIKPKQVYDRIRDVVARHCFEKENKLELSISSTE